MQADDLLQLAYGIIWLPMPRPSSLQRTRVGTYAADAAPAGMSGQPRQMLALKRCRFHTCKQQIIIVPPVRSWRHCALHDEMQNLLRQACNVCVGLLAQLEQAAWSLKGSHDQLTRQNHQ